MLLVNNEERTGKIIIENRDDIESVHSFVKVQLYCNVTADDNGHPKYHPGPVAQKMVNS